MTQLKTYDNLTRRILDTVGRSGTRRRRAELRTYGDCRRQNNSRQFRIPADRRLVAVSTVLYCTRAWNGPAAQWRMSGTDTA